MNNQQAEILFGKEFVEKVKHIRKFFNAQEVKIVTRINCNEVYGWDLRDGLGFESEQAAIETIDFKTADWGSLWKINSKIYEMTPDPSRLGIMKFEEYDEEEC